MPVAALCSIPESACPLHFARYCCSVASSACRAFAHAGNFSGNFGCTSGRFLGLPGGATTTPCPFFGGGGGRGKCEKLAQVGAGGTAESGALEGLLVPLLDGAREAEVEAGAGWYTCLLEASWAAWASDPERCRGLRAGHDEDPHPPGWASHPQGWASRPQGWASRPQGWASWPGLQVRAAGSALQALAKRATVSWKLAVAFWARAPQLGWCGDLGWRRQRRRLLLPTPLPKECRERASLNCWRPESPPW